MERSWLRRFLEWPVRRIDGLHVTEAMLGAGLWILVVELAVLNAVLVWAIGGK